MKKFKCILCLLVLFSCENVENKWVDYEIKKGQHYSSNRPLVSTTKKSQMIFDAKFSSGCLYSFDGMGIDSLDINKLYGFTDCNSTIHQNSARIGWRHNGEGKIEVFAYWYVNGVWGGEQKLGETLPNVIDNYEIKILNNNTYYFRFNSSEITTSRYQTCTGTKVRDFPYFGGNPTAPNDMVISIFEHI